MTLNITLFNKSYTLRTFSEQSAVNGYLVSDHSDSKVSIHVHPSGSEQVSHDIEGSRTTRHLEGHGNVKINVADRKRNKKGDYLWYNDEWYECISCVLWDHTMLAHYNYMFTLIPRNESGRSDDLAEPTI